MVSFTGSTRAGVDVDKNAAQTVKRVTQELGGKSPNIVLDDEFAKGVAAGVTAMMLNSGQSCNAPSRMLVPNSRMDEATMTGTFMGIPATGKTYRITATDTYQIRDGKICARWGNEDSLGMMQQLGLMEGGWRTASNDDAGSLEGDYGNS